MNRKKMILVALPIAAAAIVFVAWVLWQMVYWQAIIGMPLEKELGFSHSSPYLRFGNRTVEVFTFGSVISTGIVGRAGVSNGCIPVSLGGETDLSFTKFYRMLHASRGNTVELRVVPGGDGLEIEARPIQIVTFVVPEKRSTEPANAAHRR